MGGEEADEEEEAEVDPDEVEKKYGCLRKLNDATVVAAAVDACALFSTVTNTSRTSCKQTRPGALINAPLFITLYSKSD